MRIAEGHAIAFSNPNPATADSFITQRAKTPVRRLDVIPTAEKGQVQASGASEQDLGRENKLGLEVALMIEREFHSAGWPTGLLFGVQSEIQQRYKIGRWAVREAIRILEMRGSADMRRGRGGGLVIAQPRLKNVLQSFALYLLAEKATRADLDRAARTLAEIAAWLLLQRFHEERALAVELSATFAETGDLLSALVKMTGNSALSVMASVLDVLAGPRAETTNAFDPRRLAAISKSLVAGDMAGVADFVYSAAPAQTSGDLDLMRWIRPTTSLNACRYSTQLAFKMLGDIMRLPHVQSTFLGSERDISDQYVFSLESVRQASRILEDMGVLESRLGRKGGLFTRKPVLAEILSQTFAYLIHQRVTIADAQLAAGMLDNALARTERPCGSQNALTKLFIAMFDAFGHRKNNGAVKH
ncbi:hypothetical protein CCR94_03460 [Rhodoblastus sphagnicola]|uniref:HTH gntR-type domain-containing protein n=1 Tax=Rhodoblastus sphagnicola TaxID=333368 RepID=A0A2S6NE58_9HYPH|nr:hypothetical protein CCR94_03460 [Rhodoblastus sphagnicola]